MMVIVFILTYYFTMEVITTVNRFNLQLVIRISDIFLIQKGTHDWERRCIIFSPEKPVKSVAIFISTFEHTGQIWFDDLHLSTEISEEGKFFCGYIL